MSLRERLELIGSSGVQQAQQSLNTRVEAQRRREEEALQRGVEILTRRVEEAERRREERDAPRRAEIRRQREAELRDVEARTGQFTSTMRLIQHERRQIKADREVNPYRYPDAPSESRPRALRVAMHGLVGEEQRILRQPFRGRPLQIDDEYMRALRNVISLSINASEDQQTAARFDNLKEDLRKLNDNYYNAANKIQAVTRGNSGRRLASRTPRPINQYQQTRWPYGILLQSIPTGNLMSLADGPPVVFVRFTSGIPRQGRSSFPWVDERNQPTQDPTGGTDIPIYYNSGLNPWIEQQARREGFVIDDETSTTGPNNFGPMDQMRMFNSSRLKRNRRFRM